MFKKRATPTTSQWAPAMLDRLSVIVFEQQGQLLRLTHQMRSDRRSFDRVIADIQEAIRAGVREADRQLIHQINEWSTREARIRSRVERSTREVSRFFDGLTKIEQPTTSPRR